MNGIVRAVLKAMFSVDHALDGMVDVGVSLHVDGRLVGDFVA